ncbi:ABC transporter permease [Chelativorans sp. Marseille-P2723]|uniref:ABC transporter permease n=1 Tax=Chelativorans sp. Marseille-P2723 TaxID=2709133 RepID=UPI001570E8C3|nr:ABC transporter permease [Chelativorans sp. Marseille-P2723]
MTRSPQEITPAGEEIRAWNASRLYRWLLVAPIAFIGLFFLWPIMSVIHRSFVDPVPGLGNYERVLFAGPYLKSLWITLQTAAIVTVLCLVIAYPVAYVMARARGNLFALMTAMVVTSLWTSVVIRSYAWMVVFQRRGVLNQALVATGITEHPVNFLPGTLAVNVGMVHIMLPFMILPLLANMRSIDRSLVLAAGVMGASPWAAFRRVFLPLSIPGISAGSALVFMMSLGFFITPSLLGGPRHMMAAVMIEQQANRLLDWGLAAALSSVLLLLTVSIYLLYLRVVRHAEGGFAHAR